MFSPQWSLMSTTKKLSSTKGVRRPLKASDKQRHGQSPCRGTSERLKVLVQKSFEPPALLSLCASCQIFHLQRRGKKKVPPSLSEGLK
ncbi:hypothetical protein EVAR_63088_1 [Eumeta japonica]|uniref:Uncharacterized protein n=1 Tax=Eumeta variegata TaxID=151549 RepID=A0A4C2A078_EUMVA|nr:hypothetical protein EVAR_63088_1 [Eumeta japonica]